MKFHSDVLKITDNFLFSVAKEKMKLSVFADFHRPDWLKVWIPAFAGMTVYGVVQASPFTHSQQRQFRHFHGDLWREGW
jgi:hypothetical protein